MRVYDHFPYTGGVQYWTVPTGVTSARFECWGGAGGCAAYWADASKTGTVFGGGSPPNSLFTNSPSLVAQLGRSFANGAGYAAGTRTVVPGSTYAINVGGNGGPGFSTIKLNANGSVSVTTKGGSGGWNGGGSGGRGAHTTRNLYNSTSTKVTYTSSSLPPKATSGQLWYDTSSRLVYSCNHTYSTGASMSYWTQVTMGHNDWVGGSGGGGGGATDIQHGNSKILVAGGSGGSAGSAYDQWQAAANPGSPNPPFGTDTGSTTVPTGVDKTWATANDYVSGGAGVGGLGGATGPTPNYVPTLDGGVSTPGGSGGPAAGRHAYVDAPPLVSGSGGGGGTNTGGGSAGTGGQNPTAGGTGVGGNGANAVPNYDDWGWGGGGGGGGYYGGGGGGQGYMGGYRGRGAGGGGGSNYADSAMLDVLLAGGVRPPAGVSNSGTGANGSGGFARIGYSLAPSTAWSSIPAAALAASTFDASFTFTPAKTGGVPISHYELGTATGSTATSPTSSTTIMAPDPKATTFSTTFTAPAAGATESFFVRVTDADGDTSAWAKQVVTGLASTTTTAATITSPASGAQFAGSATVDWTPGSQSPLVAYRLGVIGNDLVTGQPVESLSGWRAGGSRVNLAPDPGFTAGGVWSSTSNTAPTVGTSIPGASGYSLDEVWSWEDDYGAEIHTPSIAGLRPGFTYRLHLGVASVFSHDPRPVEVKVVDSAGTVASTTVDLSGLIALTYRDIDLQFTPREQNTWVVVVPSSLAPDYSQPTWLDMDFEGGVVGFSAGTLSATYANSGATSLEETSSATYTVTGASLTAAGAVAGTMIASAWVYTPSGSASNGSLSAGGVTASTPTRDAWAQIRFPFAWDGAADITFTINGAAGGIWWDDVLLQSADPTAPEFGNTDNDSEHHLADFLVELVYESGAYGAWISGTVTGTDVVTDTLSYSGSLLSGEIVLDTLIPAAITAGFDGVRASTPAVVNPSLPAACTVDLQTDTSSGLVTLTINAADGAASSKTVSFDIFRNGTRVATRLTPDQTTRQSVWLDAPGSGVTATYVVRAFDAVGGYVDTADGTVH